MSTMSPCRPGLGPSSGCLRGEVTIGSFPLRGWPLTVGIMASVGSRRCVVIGAGVLGASVAARLASAGLQVTLLEADQPGRATSRWSFAWLNSNDKKPRPYHDLNQAGLRARAELAPGLDGAAWYRPVGHVELATSGQARAELAARVQR